MFVGHLAVGFAGKRLAPKTSLGTLLLASQLADVVWPLLILAGVEHARITPGITTASPLDLYDFPFSHSLLMDVVWAGLFAGAYYMARRYSRGAWVLFATVVSHWVLDWLSHRPDMQLAPGASARYGVGLWNSIPLTLAVEGGMWIAGLAIYVRSTKAVDRVGTSGFWPMIVLLTAIWLGSIFGPPPPDAHAAALSALAMVVIFAWAYWIDTHRQTTAG
jgi:hypothetical protein